MIGWYYFPEMYPVSGFFPGFFWTFSKSSYFSGFNHISKQNGWFTSQKWYFFGKSIRFSDFSGFSQNLHISVVLTIFLDKMFGLLLKNYIFSGNLSGFRVFFSIFFRRLNHFFCKMFGVTLFTFWKLIKFLDFFIYRIFLYY